MEVDRKMVGEREGEQKENEIKRKRERRRGNNVERNSSRNEKGGFNLKCWHP